MFIARSIGILLIAAGTLGLIYGGFTYTTDTHSASLGPVSMQVKEKETVYIPIAAGVAGIVFGALLLLGFKRS
jgi:hypothetical protein